MMSFKKNFIRAKMHLNTTHLAIFIIFSTFQDVLKNHLSKNENQSGIQPGIQEPSEFSSQNGSSRPTYLTGSTRRPTSKEKVVTGVNLRTLTSLVPSSH